jgi:hypothetical protein
MKTNKLFLAAFIMMLLVSKFSYAQEQKPVYITATTMHWNTDMKNFSMDEWKAVEKEYLEKVVKKNPFIRSQLVLTHYFTADNSEIILVNSYESWTDIEKASEKTTELVKAAWPDEKARKAFFVKKSNYYATYHSMPNPKIPNTSFDKDMIYYIRVSHFARTSDGTNKEFDDLSKQYFDAVINKNDFVKAYYPNEHAWGADKRNFTEVFVYESLCDIENSFKKNGELFNANWKDDASKKSFGEKMSKYFTEFHGDFIYKSVHELTK